MDSAPASPTLTAFSEVCARCDGQMVTKPDAVGRPRLRCPRCDGVSAPRPRHPDDAMLPQGLVRVRVLPEVRPGQLRCQRCARGVEGTARFCAECRSVKPATGTGHACARCGRTIPPRVGRPPKSCDDCLTPAERRERMGGSAYNQRRGAA
jgi:hypothetical protein